MLLLNCPNCMGQFSSAEAPGTKVVCPSCGQKILIPAPAPPRPAAANRTVLGEVALPGPQQAALAAQPRAVQPFPTHRPACPVCAGNLGRASDLHPIGVLFFVLGLAGAFACFFLLGPPGLFALAFPWPWLLWRRTWVVCTVCGLHIGQ